MSNKSNHKCRLCLVDCDSNKMQDLFTKAETNCRDPEDMRADDDFSQLPLVEKVEYCCGVKVTYHQSAKNSTTPTNNNNYLLYHTVNFQTAFAH